MTRKEVQAIMNSVRIANVDMDRKRAQIDHLRSILQKVTASYGEHIGSSGSVNPDKLLDAIAEIEQLERELNADIIALTEVYGKVSRLIDTVPDVRMRQVLDMRYLRMLGWERIKRESHYSEYVYELHRKALDYLAKSLVFLSPDVL